MAKDVKDLIPFTEVSVKEHLDKCIVYWRKWKSDPDIGLSDIIKANCYIDAYQSMRTSLFGETLPK